MTKRDHIQLHPLFIIGSLLTLIVISAIQFRGSAIESRYKPAKADGPYEIEAVEEMVLHDAKRNKDLPVKISFPKAKGKFPIIVFSHGAGGSGTNYFPLTRFWATHGYVVIQPTHADSIKLRREQGERVGIFDVLADDTVTDPQSWENRARDVTFVLDSLGEIERRATGLKGKLDSKKIGVGGHSYGAYTTQLIGGAGVHTMGEDKLRTYRDDRPLALLLLSPQGKTLQGLTESSWNSMTRPMMSMTGTYDRGRGGQTPEWRMEPYKYSPVGDKYHVFINGAYHASFTGRLAEADGTRGVLARPALGSAQTAEQKAIFDYIKMASLAFWDAYLKGGTEARAYLRSDSLAAYSNGGLRFDRK